MEGTVLVIDDDPGVRKALKRILTGAGFEFEEAGDAFVIPPFLMTRLTQASTDCEVIEVTLPATFNTTLDA